MEINKRIETNKSLRFKVLRSFIYVTLITLFIMEMILMFVIKKHYYKNIEDTLTSSIEFTLTYYQRYLSNYSLEEIVAEDVDVFWNHTNAEVQLIDPTGKLVMDSIGVIEEPLKYPDVVSAFKGTKSYWYGKVDYTDSKVLSVSMPLNRDGETIGVVRFISSLEPTDKILSGLFTMLIIVGFAIALIATLISTLLANKIVNPIIKLTDIAQRIGDGQLHIRSEIDLKDEIGQLSDALNTMANDLQKKEQLKNEFISSISHELRTPLTSIKGWAATLRDIRPGEEYLYNDGLKIIEEETDRLAKMVEELLDFSRYATGKFTLEKTNVDISALVKQVYIQMKPRVKKNISFSISLARDHIYIEADQDRIKQMLINILDNSIKFTPEGGNVDVTLTETSNQIVIFINDSGIGMTPNELTHAKDKFFKGKNKESHTGLGLSIADEIATLHGGRLDIESEYGKGTSVVIRLPRGERDEK